MSGALAASWCRIGRRSTSSSPTASRPTAPRPPTRPSSPASTWTSPAGSTTFISPTRCGPGACESLVLLQNRGDVLPLAPGMRSVAVVGALAASAKDHLGPHAARGHREDTVTILDGVRQRAERAGVAVVHSGGFSLRWKTTEGFAAAVEAAGEADAVIAVLGEPEALSGEAASRAHLSLTGHQPELLAALAATGKPVVVVLMAGRPLEIR